MTGRPSHRSATALWVATALLPTGAFAQSPEPSRPFHVGATVGTYHESTEGDVRSASIAPGLVMGLGGPRWSFQVEIGDTGEHCGGSSGSCHSHRWYNVGFVRRFRTTGASPYVAFGCCLVHLGAGVEVPVHERFVLAPGVDLNLIAPDAAAVRPKVAVLARW